MDHKHKSLCLVTRNNFSKLSYHLRKLQVLDVHYALVRFNKIHLFY